MAERKGREWSKMQLGLGGVFAEKERGGERTQLDSSLYPRMGDSTEYSQCFYRTEEER
jgi:hypothetical protein